MPRNQATFFGTPSKLLCAYGGANIGTPGHSIHRSSGASSLDSLNCHLHLTEQMPQGRDGRNGQGAPGRPHIDTDKHWSVGPPIGHKFNQAWPLPHRDRPKGALAVALPIGRRILSFQGDNSGNQLDNNVA
uniref:HDC08947 n=1 Tax=Drosophila melanogaster TaxID=7227 RepID=Q6ILM3_DROME|nr:TPA_inf: HDC08947 [Drosophila melanogaster]